MLFESKNSRSRVPDRAPKDFLLAQCGTFGFGAKSKAIWSLQPSKANIFFCEAERVGVEGGCLSCEPPVPLRAPRTLKYSSDLQSNSKVIQSDTTVLEVYCSTSSTNCKGCGILKIAQPMLAQGYSFEWEGPWVYQTKPLPNNMLHGIRHW